MTENKKEKKMYKFTIKCNKSADLTRADNVASTFRCPECDMALVWDPVTRKLGSHGKDDRTVGHVVRVVEEL